MSICGARLDQFRRELAARDLQGFVVPLTDEHLSEYVGAYARRLAWLTGFEGSAGCAVVLPSQAAMFVDGRYTLQVREQVDAAHWSYESVPATSEIAWLGEHVPAGARVGYDPWLHTKKWVAAARTAVARRGAHLAAVQSNPVDSLWIGKPQPSLAKVDLYPDEIAGRTSEEKRRDVAEFLRSLDADCVALGALDSIAWLFNVRGRDVEHTPVVLAFALVYADATADLFVVADKLTESVMKHLGPAVRMHPREDFLHRLKRLSGKRVAVDQDRTVVQVIDALEAAGAKVIEARDPAVLAKATKTPSEIAGHKAAQLRDGAAVVRFLHWLSIEGPKGSVTEQSAAERLREFREDSGRLRDSAFDTISGFGPNGAIVHYRVTERSCRGIEPGSLYLIDSGGQYLDGTTDVTRTVTIGAPTVEMRDRFTRVLKGHIALATAVFPAGTRGGQLDALARRYLWDVGLDYAHGTGHGVGAYLAVHEGPQRIAATGDAGEALMPGMILSNEPGYYKAGEYGIRIENLMLVTRRQLEGAEREMLGFETLTFAPIQQELIHTPMLTAAERAWIDSYHSEVARLIGPQLDPEAKAWLMRETRALT